MRIAQVLAVAAVASLAAASTAGAQDQGKVGITMGYPASVGVLWRASDKVAIRPELSISGGQSGVTLSSFSSESDGWAMATGVSALFYLHKYDNLRTYFSPRFTYSRTTNTTTSSLPTAATAPGFAPLETKSTTRSSGGTGSIGAEYALGNKFAVFGEVGFGFSHQTSKSSTSATRSTGNTWGSRAGVGVVFFP